MKVWGRRFAARGWRVVVGDANSPLQRMHLAFLFFAAWVGAFSGAFNVVLSLSPPLYGLALEGFASIVLWMWYRSRWRADAERMAWWFCLMIIFVMMPINWLFNQGMSGPTLMFFLMAAAYSLGVIPAHGWRRWLVLAGFLIMPALMILLESRHPRWVEAYPSVAQRATDLIVSYYLNVAILLIMVSGHIRRVKSEQRLSRDYAARLREQARRDSLTGLLNHAAFHATAEARLALAGDRSPGWALVIYDLDHFKQVNDKYGHPYGDKVLLHFAALLSEVAQLYDAIVGRCGGEEFCVLMPRASQALIETFDGRLRERCCSQPLAQGEIHFSGGGALAPEEGSVTLWFERADRALYAAKHAGRDRLIVSDDRLTLSR
ncbi:GGDEF domain-containing protein [Halomonas sp. HP20-15]|uniref:GGDEF domain-containing protein n=1 Tax=Halomonas sp. HP20-15 TaxID=3085901 RepID=UPI0029824821|nr:GGDEF domain-containing protein [Halomonas sp. HP20-15]MDW5376609.1 GGDEF domain-containing protein [Halomonas sp. HP20-15]